MSRAGIIIFFDPNNKNYMIVRSTNWHPVPKFRHKLKGVGGLVEENENSVDAALRELQEEFPNWWLRIPGTRRKFGNVPCHLDSSLYLAGTTCSKNIEWHVFIAPADLGLRSFRLARSLATESTPEFWDIGSYPNEVDCLPGFLDAIKIAHDGMYKAYPNLQNIP